MWYPEWCILVWCLTWSTSSGPMTWNQLTLSTWRITWVRKLQAVKQVLEHALRTWRETSGKRGVEQPCMSRAAGFAEKSVMKGCSLGLTYELKWMRNQLSFSAKDKACLNYLLKPSDRQKGGLHVYKCSPREKSCSRSTFSLPWGKS